MKIQSALRLCAFALLSNWAGAEQPNVVLVMADDIGLGDLSFYQKERNPDQKSTVDTPNIDGLIAEGMRFSDAHSPASLCAPTRFAMMTGNYPYRNHSPFGVWTPHSDSGIEPNFTTIARIAKAGGYQTAFLGKWGLGDSTKSRKKGFEKLAKGALHFGFDYALELPQGIQGYPFAFYENQEWMKLGDDSEFADVGPKQNGYHDSKKHNDLVGIGDSNWDPTQAGPILANKAVDYIEGHADKPFFLYYCSQAVHIPHTPVSELDGVKIVGATPGRHGDMIKELDVQVGMMVKALKKAGVYQNTLFVFTSDNGGLSWDKEMKAAGHDTSNGLNGSKGSILEGGHRVPFVAVWPGKIAAGSQSDAQIVGQDMVATVAALGGQELDRSKVLDSLNLLPLFKGEEGKEGREVMVHQAKGKGGVYALRKGPWKLIMEGKNSQNLKGIKATALFNLDDNLAEDYSKSLFSDPAQKDRLKEMMAEFLALRSGGEPTVK
ncbi:MAG: sulfatase family protein [Roseibacillus sp.]